MGGSTAGLAAALAAAREFYMDSAVAGGPRRLACLVEPTDWPGGQMTSSGVSAVDWAHHDVPVTGTRIDGFNPTPAQAGKQISLSRLTRQVANNPVVFADWMERIAPAFSGSFEMSNNPGFCWVSMRCYEPEQMVGFINGSLDMLVASGNLKVFTRSVPKRILLEGRRIKSLEIIQRTPKSVNEYSWNHRLSAILEDWYSPVETEQYSKMRIVLAPLGTSFPYVIDGSEWGELLVLSGASYMQGVELSESNPEVTNETCGQAFVFPVALQMAAQPVSMPAWWGTAVGKIPYPTHYSFVEPNKPFSFDDIWSYRRLRVARPPASSRTRGVPVAAAGEISSQNWTTGNDYPYRYLFLKKADAAGQIADWKGGVDVTALAEAEVHALGWVKFFQDNAPDAWRGRIGLSSAYGTETGLAKVPYIRDTRRSVGISNFVLKYDDILQGRLFADTIAVGAYAADIHATKTPGCSLPPHVAAMNPLPKPFNLPLIAHTNRDLDNFLVAGKLMAQTFATSSATRLHPIEFGSGTGVGVAAAYLQGQQILTPSAVTDTRIADEIRRRIASKHGPVQWRNVEAALK
jgi:hypothetical protein